MRPTPARKTVRPALFLLDLCACALLLVAGCKSAPPPETIVTVQAEHPQRGPISEHIVASAVLAPIAQAAIAPRISAPVKKFYVERGARVRAGQLLATLDDSDLLRRHAHGGRYLSGLEGSGQRFS